MTDEAPRIIEPGSVWAVGPHLVICDDFDRAATWLRPDPPPVLAYTSPPWSTSAQVNYLSAAGRPTRDVDLQELLWALARAVRTLGATRFLCEIGEQSREPLFKALAMNGWYMVHRHQTTYAAAGERRGSYIIEALRTTDTIAVPAAPARHEDCPAWAIEAFTAPGDSVLDLMAGEGQTATAAVKAGRVFFGVEINPRRVETLLKKLTGLTEHEAVQIGATPTRAEGTAD